MMVTGDNKITARAIAEDCNILDKHNDNTSRVMEGPDFWNIIGGVVCKNCKENNLKDWKNCDCVDKVDTILNGEEFDKI